MSKKLAFCQNTLVVFGIKGTQSTLLSMVAVLSGCGAVYPPNVLGTFFFRIHGTIEFMTYQEILSQEATTWLWVESAG